MTEPLIYSKPDFVDVVWRSDLKAVHLIWHSEYDEGRAVRDAVLAALAYVNDNGVENWLADISHSQSELSPADLAWVNSEDFRAAIRASSLTRFVLIPPLPETGQDTGWLVDWEKNTLAAFGDGKIAKIMSDMNDIRVLFHASERGE